MCCRYVFCCAPIPTQSAFVTTMFLKYTRRFSEGGPITVQWLKEQIGWPLATPSSVNELTHLEATHDTLDLYNWLSFRFEVGILHYKVIYGCIFIFSLLYMPLATLLYMPRYPECRLTLYTTSLSMPPYHLCHLTLYATYDI